MKLNDAAMARLSLEIPKAAWPDRGARIGFDKNAERLRYIDDQTMMFTGFVGDEGADQFACSMIDYIAQFGAMVAIRHVRDPEDSGFWSVSLIFTNGACVSEGKSYRASTLVEALATAAVDEFHRQERAI